MSKKEKMERVEELMDNIKSAVKEGANDIEKVIQKNKKWIEGMLEDINYILKGEFEGEDFHDIIIDKFHKIIDNFPFTIEMDYQQTLQYDIDFQNKNS